MGENLVTLVIICAAGKWIHSKSILVSIVSKKVWIHSHHKASTSLGIVAIRVLGAVGVSWRQPSQVCENAPSAHVGYVGTTWNQAVLGPLVPQRLGRCTTSELDTLLVRWRFRPFAFPQKNQPFWKASQF